MPTKHIDDQTWRRVEQETVRAVVATKANLKDTEVLKILILKGLAAVKEEDYQAFIAAKKKR